MESFDLKNWLVRNNIAVLTKHYVRKKIFQPLQFQVKHFPLNIHLNLFKFKNTHKSLKKINYF